MRYAKRTFLAGTTWLTATATLFAGLPRVECLGASGQGKTSTPAVAVAASRCCCASGQGCKCCQAQARPSCTESQGGPPAARDVKDGPRIEPAQCVRGIVLTEEQGLARTPSQDIDPAGPVITQAPQAILPPPEPCLIWCHPSAHAPAPPVDLVCLLQHLLI